MKTISRPPQALGDNPSHPDSQAVAWADALGAAPDDQALRAACRQWCEADPAHAAAFARIDRAYQQARAAGRHRILLDLENETLARVAATARHARRRQRRRRLTLAVAAAAGLCAVVVSLGFYSGGRWDRLQYLPEHARTVLAGHSYYRTDIGERRTVALADGSTLTLNTATRAVVDLQPHSRTVHLLSGEALFEVARDRMRPFRVHAGQRTITALGTVFDVRLDRERLEVTLIEGKVEVVERVTAHDQPPAERDANPSAKAPVAEADAVRGTAPPSRAMVLSPGQRLIARASTAPLIEPANPDRTTAWRQGQIIFENEPLQAAVAELNRYSRRQLRLEDARLHDMRVSGAFNTSDTRNFVNMLTVYLPVRVVAVDSQQIVLGHVEG